MILLLPSPGCVFRRMALANTRKWLNLVNEAVNDNARQRHPGAETVPSVGASQKGIMVVFALAE